MDGVDATVINEQPVDNLADSSESTGENEGNRHQSDEPSPPNMPEGIGVEQLPGARVLEIQVELNAAGNRIMRPVMAGAGGMPHMAPPVWANLINQPRYAQNHVFRALFFRVARSYIAHFPEGVRRGLEFALAIQAFIFLGMLTYVHVNYGHLSLPCLKNMSFTVEENFRECSYANVNVDELPKYSVLRIEVVDDPVKENYTLVDSYLKEFRPVDVIENWLESSITSTDLIDDLNETMNDSLINQTASDEIFAADSTVSTSLSDNWFWMLSDAFKSEASLFTNHHIVEFAEDYGLLRLSPKARRALNITVLLAVVNSNDTCIGSWLDRVILTELLGFDEIVIASIRNILPNSTRRGFVRNVITGETYRFVPASLFSPGAFPPVFSLLIAAVVMLLFTVLVALLLRYSHHQIYACVVDALSSFEHPAQAPGIRGHAGFRLIIPIVPLLVIVLAMVGLETVMAEFFQDSPTAFYVIVTIWLADQFYALACHSPASRKWWPRFFFAYHFAFYAYYCRFSGQFGQLALAASWLFIQHSMLFFVHHFELPAVEHARE